MGKLDDILTVLTTIRDDNNTVGGLLTQAQGTAETNTFELAAEVEHTEEAAQAAAEVFGIEDERLTALREKILEAQQVAAAASEKIKEAYELNHAATAVIREAVTLASAITQPE